MTPKLATFGRLPGKGVKAVISRRTFGAGAGTSP